MPRLSECVGRLPSIRAGAISSKSLPERGSAPTRSARPRDYLQPTGNRKQASARTVDELIESNLGFVFKVASQFQARGLPFEDLVGEGTLGLIEAAHRYDASMGTKFITYAVWWVRKMILVALSERSRLIGVPSSQTKKIREIRDAENSLGGSLGRKPTKEEIAAELERSLSRIDEELQRSLCIVSLDHNVGKERNQSIHELLADDTATNAEDEFISRENATLLSKALRDLTEQERTVVCYRFGLDGGGSRTLMQVGEIMNVSRERIRQIQKGAVARMSRAINRRPNRSRRLGQTSRRGTSRPSAVTAVSCR